MAQDPITANNRANAQKSTGPKTEAGKAVVAQNAKRHGITGRPDPHRVQAWLAIILDQPKITPSDLLPGDDYSFLALKLAEAEERLVAAQEAMRAFEQTDPVMPDDLMELVEDFRDLLKFSQNVDEFAPHNMRELRLRLKILDGDCDPAFMVPSIYANRYRLLQRYLKEARARRNRAFAAWIDMAADENAYQLAEPRAKAPQLLRTRYI